MEVVRLHVAKLLLGREGPDINATLQAQLEVLGQDNASRQADFAPRLVWMWARMTSSAVAPSPSTIASNSRVCSCAFSARSSALRSTWRPWRR